MTGRPARLYVARCCLDNCRRGRWIEAAVDLLDRLWTTQAAAIDEAVALCATAIGGGGLVHLFGTGHSRIPVEEMFPRYGSYPGFHPIVELSTTFHTQVVGANGQRQAMFIERVEGLAEVILSNFRLRPAGRDDRLQRQRARAPTRSRWPWAPGGGPAGDRRDVDRPVDAGEPTHSSGTRLLDHADVVIDLCTPAADALIGIDGLATPVGPGSSVAAVAIVNEIKVQTAERLVERGRDAAGADECLGRWCRGVRPAVRGRVPEHARRLAAALAVSADVAVDGGGGEDVVDDHHGRADDAGEVAGGAWTMRSWAVASGSDRRYTISRTPASSGSPASATACRR